MKKEDFKENLLNLLDKSIDNKDYSQKIDYVMNIIIDYEKENEGERDLSNKGKSWTDEELKIILSDAPLKSNCLKYAKIFRRGYGSIEQIYRWSTTPNKNLSGERKNNAFIKQIKKVAKELGFKG